MSRRALCGLILGSLWKYRNYEGGVNMAITTIPISVKLDLHTFSAIEAECNVTGEKRNRLINKAIDFYIEHLDTERKKACGIL